MRERLKREYFDKLYAESPDPWEFTTSEYERRKYEQTLEVLQGRRFRRALEVGASIGVFTKMLAPYCDELLAVDTSERAVELARRRLSGWDNVRLEQRTLPEEMPEGPFDLILASEVLYYLPQNTMLKTLDVFEDALAPNGMLLAVHWRKETRTYPLQGDEVHELLASNTNLTNVKTIVEAEYRLDLFEDLT
ncbi:MAG: SAM-dependent methyltransferase [Rubrobacteraceae bacterium]